MNVSTGAPLLTLQNPIPNADAHFGWSAASIGDNLIAVGAPDDNIKAGDSGAVYIFDATTGALLHTLYAPTPQYEGRFGSSLTATGNGVLLVGSELDNTAVSGGGAVYAFDATTGQLLTTLVGSKRNYQGRFGESLAVLPDESLLVGASQGDVGPGVAYRFSQVPEPSAFG